ncbi:unnamed protein product [[Candida] boidinii]|uniref:Unnamed protein product n=1 Tax=Candida boidinii TaxID=5477 RepID=A0ACB5TPZ5_CANBO|nr:unnamed protein product [[Candida] boidinii]
MRNHKLKDDEEEDKNSSINYGGKVNLKSSKSISEKNYGISSTTESIDTINECNNSSNNIRNEYSINENPIVPGLFPSFTPCQSNNKTSMVESSKKYNKNVKNSSIDTDEISKKMLNVIDFYYNNTQKGSISSDTTNTTTTTTTTTTTNNNNNNNNNNIQKNDSDSNLLIDYESVYLNLGHEGSYEYSENYDDINNFQSSPLSSLSPQSPDDTLDYQANYHENEPDNYNYLNNSNNYNISHSPTTYTCNNRFNNNNDTSDLFPSIDYSQFNRNSPNYISLTPSGKN